MNIIPIMGTIFFILLILKLRFLSIDLNRVINLGIFKGIYHSISDISIFQKNNNRILLRKIKL